MRLAFGLLWLARVPIVLASVLVIVASLTLSGFEPRAISIAAVGAMLMGGYVRNDILDRDSDAVAAPHRPIPAGMVDVSEARIFSLALWFASGVAVALEGRVWLAAYVGLYAISFVLYSKFWRRHWVVKNLSTAIWFASAGLAPFIMEGQISSASVVLSVWVAIFTLGREIFMDVRDHAELSLSGYHRPYATMAVVPGALLMLTGLAGLGVMVRELWPPWHLTLLVVAAALLLKASTGRSALWRWSELAKVALIVVLLAITASN